MPETGFLEFNGARLYYEAAGDGPALVLIHAGIADSRMWDAQFAEFARHCRVVRYDTRGFGRTQTEAVEFSNREDLAGLLDHLGIERATVVGVSRGGQIAGDFALEFPHRVSGLVTVCAGMSGFDYESVEDAAALELDKAIFEAQEAKDWDRAAELDVRLWVDGPGQPVGRAPAAARELVRQMTYDNMTRHHGDEKPLVLDPPAAGRLDEIRVPTLVIIGALDTRDTVAVADALAEGIPGAQKVVFENAAHVPSLEEPERFNQVLLEFLQANGLAN
ncbi:MAG TPA: alpha/beta hydrolase [Herpetosiphonaceae bacterium]|nr:alpha/beta hydrolase [Herpetosiphonaceae bacterium]